MGYIDASWAGERGGSAAEWITQKECAAYDYCINGLQELLPNSDVERILEGSGLILMGGFKMAGGAFLTFAGALTSYTGIGFGGVAAGTVTGVSGISDIEQGINEIKLRLRNDRTTQTRNYVRDTLYDGNDTIYHLSTGTVAMAGIALKPYVMPKRNPVLAGGEQKNIAQKAAMGADDAVGGVGTKVDVNIDTILKSASKAKKGGKTVAGHALQKHAGRNPNIWGSISGNSESINNMAMQHIDDIINGPGYFKVVESNGRTFLEKMLPDGRGVRLNMDGAFKGFIDQIG